MLHSRLLGAGATLLAFAAASALWPREASAPPEPTSVSLHAAPEGLALQHRLSEADAVLTRSKIGLQSRRLPDDGLRLSVVGGAPAEAEPHAVRLERRLSTTPNRTEHDDCGGTLYAGGWIVTAAHCVDGSWEFIRAYVEQDRRGGSYRAAYDLGESVLHRYFEGCGSAEADACRHDVALLKLPEDPGGGLAWPQSAQIAMEPGERARICGFGLTEARTTSEILRCVEMPVVWARAGILRLDGSSGAHFDQGDSGSGVFRSSTGTQTAIVSHIGGDPRTGERRFYAMPFPRAWADGVRVAWGG